MGINDCFTFILRISVKNIQSNISKFLSDPESWSSCQFFLILVPSDDQFRIMFRLNSAAEVNRFTLSNSSGLDFGDELRSCDFSLIFKTSQFSFAL